MNTNFKIKAYFKGFTLYSSEILKFNNNYEFKLWLEVIIKVKYPLLVGITFLNN